MNELNNNLKNPKFKENPFTTPENYFQEMRVEVMDRIKEQENMPERQGILYQLKPYAYLVATFVLLFGIGYGAKLLTPGLTSTDSDELYALIEDGYISSSFIDYMYDDVYLDEDSEIYQNITLSEDASSELEADLSLTDIYNYIDNNY